jgi:type IV pilus assembly protein PilY1
MRKISLLVFLLLVLIPTSYVYGLDTDLYTVSAVDIPPNVLIILDNSGSMNNEIAGAVYDPQFQYPFVVSSSPNGVYYKTNQGWTFWRDQDSIDCVPAKNALISEGNYRGKVNLGTSSCGGSNQELATGNYLNYLNATGGSGNLPRFGLAKGIIHSYINTTDNVRFGLMVFNYENGGRILYPVSNTWLPEHKTGIYNALAGLQADSNTPLAETLYEAGLYFKGNIGPQPSLFNAGVSYGQGGTYPSPVLYYCQKNYVILITDGEPTKDIMDLADVTKGPILTTIGAAVGDPNGDRDQDGLDYGDQKRVYENYGSDYLDDVALYLNQDVDLSPAVTDKQHNQNITTYTVGFTWNSPLLQDTAKNGGGKYFYAHNAQSFIVALQSIIAEILEKSTSYVAPVVPISQMEKMSSGNRMYIAMFKPTMKSFWKGNIKKFGIATENSGDIKIGDILDSTGSPAMEVLENGAVKIRDNAKSYWAGILNGEGLNPDGEDVEKGGVGEVLLKRTATRNIRTYLGTSTNLMDSSNVFNAANITPQTLDLNPTETAERDNIVNFIYGLDSYDENGNGITSEKRDWILGAFIHSKPVVIHYGTQSVIYAGANDGMLHAFDDATGEEIWAFIPPNLLPRLKNLQGEALEFFVDGAPRAYIERNSSGSLTKAILIFGQRRGGNVYLALDVTYPDAPQWLWDISPSRTGYSQLGQTWSTPQLGKIDDGTASGKSVAFIGGGYDETNQDLLSPMNEDSKGTAVYVVDISNGNRIWSYSKANNPQMKYCIPSDIARVDTDGNGKMDRLYVGDIGGQIWRFDIGGSDTTQWTAKAKIIFDLNSGESNKRKIFYAPDVTFENNYEMLLFGTGDREHPKETTKVNRLYAIKDENPSSVLTENNLSDVTEDLLQTGTATQKTLALNDLNSKEGWFIKLDQNPGEKCLSNAIIFAGVVYYTTFTPTVGKEDDICFVGEGTGRLYAVDYKTGNAVFNLDGLGTIGALTRSDRSEIIGTAIPSGVIITFIGGSAVGYTAAGIGVSPIELRSPKTIIPINWRIVF